MRERAGMRRCWWLVVTLGLVLGCSEEPATGGEGADGGATDMASSTGSDGGVDDGGDVRGGEGPRPRACSPPGDAREHVVRTDAEVERLETCTRLLGSLVVQGEVQDLQGVRWVEVIEGDLVVANAVGLESLAPLGRLETVTGSLRITRASSLRSLQGLEGLRALGGSVNLAQNPSLEDIGALAGVEGFGGNFSLEGAPKLTGGGGLAMLSGGIDDLLIKGTALTDLAPLGELLEVRNLTIESNPGLTSVERLSGLQAIGGAVRIRDNTALPSCQVEAVLAAIGEGNIAGPVATGGNDFTAMCD